jgi:hypothetical protein
VYNRKDLGIHRFGVLVGGWGGGGGGRRKMKRCMCLAQEVMIHRKGAGMGIASYRYPLRRTSASRTFIMKRKKYLLPSNCIVKELMGESEETVLFTLKRVICG